MSETIQTKTCRICKQTKPLSEFYKHVGSKDGHFNRCKSCQKIYVAKYQKTTKGKATNLKSVRKYQKTAKGKTASRKGVNKYRKTEKGRATMKRFKARHPNQVKAKYAVQNATRVGRLPHPNTRLCHYCPKPAQQYHHHKGYEPKHWLDVVPTCVFCHHNL